MLAVENLGQGLEAGQVQEADLEADLGQEEGQEVNLVPAENQVPAPDQGQDLIPDQGHHQDQGQDQGPYPDLEVDQGVDLQQGVEVDPLQEVGVDHLPGHVQGLLPGQGQDPDQEALLEVEVLDLEVKGPQLILMKEVEMKVEGQAEKRVIKSCVFNINVTPSAHVSFVYIIWTAMYRMVV